MKSTYHDRDTNSIADVGEIFLEGFALGGARLISRINVPREHRGRGHGSRLLERITADADAEGIELWLQPVPSGPLDTEALVAWYLRHGFTDKVSVYMVRPPKS